MDQDQINNLVKEKNSVYWERNQLVAALSKVLPAYLAKHPLEDKEWESDWRTIVVIELPAYLNKIFNMEGPTTDLQMTWHVHDSDVSMFDHLRYKREDEQQYFWDGHDSEEKYRRLRMLKDNLTADTKRNQV